MTDDSFVNWADVQRKIPGSDHPASPLNAIRGSFPADHEPESFEHVNKRLNEVIEELRQSFEKLTRQ